MKQMFTKFFLMVFSRDRIFLCFHLTPSKLGSSVSIVSDYRLDDWVSVPNRDRGFFL
jgi:hypothetical protein